MAVSVEVAEARCRYGVFRFPANDEFAGRSLREYGEWGQQELSLILSFLEEDQVAIDGGAFVGTHSIPMARSVGSGGVVHAFEPNKLVFPLLLENLRKNDVTNVLTYPYALSHVPGTLYQQGVTGERYVNYGNNQPNRLPQDDDSEAVTAVQIDNLRLEKCDLMKLDLEGMEPNALIGASITIEKHHPILYVECNSIENGWMVVNILRPYGYQFWLHPCEAFLADNFNHSTVDIFDKGVETSLVCIAQESQQHIKKLLLYEESLYPVSSLDDLALGFVQSGKIKEAAFGFNR
ncbi:MAG: FkbM family methyltransferase [Ktedonobacterales bacterium]